MRSWIPPYRLSPTILMGTGLILVGMVPSTVEGQQGPFPDPGPAPMELAPPPVPPIRPLPPEVMAEAAGLDGPTTDRYAMLVDRLFQETMDLRARLDDIRQADRVAVALEEPLPAAGSRAEVLALVDQLHHRMSSFDAAVSDLLTPEQLGRFRAWELGHLPPPRRS